MTIRAVTFDVYSALYEAPTGLARGLAPVLRQRGVAGDPHAVARSWRHKQREYLLIANSLGLEPASNRKAIEASVRYTLRGLEPPVTPDELRALLGTWGGGGGPPPSRPLLIRCSPRGAAVSSRIRRHISGRWKPWRWNVRNCCMSPAGHRMPWAPRPLASGPSGSTAPPTPWSIPATRPPTRSAICAACWRFLTPCASVAVARGAVAETPGRTALAGPSALR